MSRQYLTIILLLLLMVLAACNAVPSLPPFGEPPVAEAGITITPPLASPVATEPAAPTPVATVAPTETGESDGMVEPPGERLEELVVEGVTFRISESSPVQVQAVVQGSLPDACSFIERVEQAREGETFTVSLAFARRPNQRCAPQTTPFEQVVLLDVAGLPAGLYRVQVHGTVNTFELPARNDAPPASATPESTSCLYRAGFLADVTIPDGASVAPGDGFLKTWRVRNMGDCAWDPATTLRYVGGTTLSGADNAPAIGRTVAPGESVDLSIELTAPDKPGRYLTEWLLDSDGSRFGVGPDGRVPLFVDFVVAGEGSPDEPATIMGWIWADHCHIIAGEGGDGGEGTPTGGCIEDGLGGYRADGIPNNGERGIEGVTVSLRPGECPSSGATEAIAVTDEWGEFTFANLPAGVYCVFVDVTMEHAESNIGILYPGGWTSPPGDFGGVAVTLAPGESERVELGWDYQFQ